LPGLVFSRPVYDVEMSAGIETKIDSKIGSAFDPDVTFLIDAYWRVKSAFDGYAVSGMFADPSKAIAHYIACNYYDCMSGGCQAPVLSILRYACEEFGVPNDTDAYPGDNGWQTIGDFLAETAGTPNIEGLDMKQLPDLTVS